MTDNRSLVDLIRGLPGGAPSLVSTPGVEELLARVLLIARAPWPEIAVADDIFLRLVVRALPAGSASSADLLELRLPDLYLYCAYRSGDQAAARSIESEYMPRVASAVKQLRVPGADVADILQIVSRRMLEVQEQAGYSGSGDLVGWMCVIAMREVGRMRRKTRREVPLEERLFLEPASTKEDHELTYLKTLYRKEFKEAFAKALDALSIRDRAILRYYTLDKLNIDEIGALYGVHRATIARWIAAARDQLFTGTRDAMRERLKVGRRDFESILRLISSQLDVSLERVLGRAEE